MIFLDNNSTNPHYNLAFDEYCLEHLPAGEQYCYLWQNKPSVIIGLNQNAYAEVNMEYLRSNGVELARRVTGGGAVYHDFGNLNYSLVGEGVSPAPIVEALRCLGVDAELSGRNDIFVDGRKVSGYARRKSCGRELVHGTLMYDVDLEALTRVLDVDGSKLASRGVASVRSRVANLRELLPQFSSVEELKNALDKELSRASDADGAKRKFCWSEAELAEIQRLADDKFATWDWVYAHSRQMSLIRKERFSCGSVEVCLNVDRGVIVDVDFRGDFLGESPSSELTCTLKGAKYDYESLEALLASVDVSRFFSGLRQEDLLALMLPR